MSWENLGSVSSGNMLEDETWIIFALNLAKAYVQFACRELPIGCKIEIQWDDHELGGYPYLGLISETYIPEKYIAEAENALRVFDCAVSWSTLREHFEQQTAPEAD